MVLTSIGSQKTPGRPTEITFAGETGLPSDAQIVLLIGRAASGTTGTNTVISISNVADDALAKVEAEALFGAGSEAANMVIAAVKANAGGSTFPALKVCPLASSATDIPAGAVTAIKAVKAEFVVSPYDLSTDAATRTALKDIALTMSGAQRVSNNQYGTFGVGANRSVVDASTLNKADSQYLVGLWLRDTGSGGTAPAYTLGEVAAAAAAVLAANGVPYNPVNDLTIQNLAAPLKQSDWATVGAGLEVAFVRAVTTRLSADGTGTPVVGAYYDVADFQVLYFWRKTLATRYAQPDFKRTKASRRNALNLKAEAIRLAQAFQDQGMFQAVDQLAKSFVVERNASDRHRFDVKTPVNVIPGLHVVASNIEATTEFDTITV
jgi:phage tail sheath gpL-like